MKKQRGQLSLFHQPRDRRKKPVVTTYTYEPALSIVNKCEQAIQERREETMRRVSSIPADWRNREKGV